MENSETAAVETVDVADPLIVVTSLTHWMAKVNHHLAFALGMGAHVRKELDGHVLELQAFVKDCQAERGRFIAENGIGFSDAPLYTDIAAAGGAANASAAPTGDQPTPPPPADVSGTGADASGQPVITGETTPSTTAAKKAAKVDAPGESVDAGQPAPEGQA